MRWTPIRGYDCPLVNRRWVALTGSNLDLFNDMNETVNRLLLIPFISVHISLTGNCELITATKSRIVLVVFRFLNPN